MGDGEGLAEPPEGKAHLENRAFYEAGDKGGDLIEGAEGEAGGLATGPVGGCREVATPRGGLLGEGEEAGGRGGLSKWWEMSVGLQVQGVGRVS